MEFKLAPVRNQKAPMEYRRFGKTNEYVSVITLGGMRYKHGWNEPREDLPDDTLKQCAEVTRYSLDLGINLIETAYGYVKSEHLYAKVLNDILQVPRSSYHLMTKGNASTAVEMRKLVEKQLRTLQTDHFDFYAWHGINNADILKVACAKNGPVYELLKMKKEGIIRHVGFSTHAPLEVVIEAIESDWFDFVNLHYYYFYQRLQGAVNLAEAKNMGVFIISPNDKGGQLFKAPEKLRRLTAPSTPIQWNARFCLSNPAVHTLSFGMTELSHVDEMKGLFPTAVPLSDPDLQIKLKLDGQVLDVPYGSYEGYDMLNDPSHLNIPEILRFRRMALGYDMMEFAWYRYNMFQEKDHWFPGLYATDANIAKINEGRIPQNVPLKELLAETHRLLYKPKK